MEVDIIFDTVCPWCFIGKRRFEEALALRPNLNDLTINWRPFLLNPEMPVDGVDRSAYLTKKFGSESRIRRIYGAIEEAGLSVEIDFAFNQINRTPNSINSHRLVRFAQQHGKATELVESLFVEYFLIGRDIGDMSVLMEIAIKHGLDTMAVTDLFDSDHDIYEILSENAQAHELGINGVPAYTFNGKMIISGAQEPQVLARMLDVAQQTHVA